MQKKGDVQKKVNQVQEVKGEAHKDEVQERLSGIREKVKHSKGKMQKGEVQEKVKCKKGEVQEE